MMKFVEQKISKPKIDNLGNISNKGIIKNLPPGVDPS